MVSSYKITDFLEKAWFIFPILLFGLMFFLPALPQVQNHGIQVLDEVFFLVSGLLIYFSLSKKAWGWKSLAFFLTLAIFYLPLLRIWQNAASNFNSVLGLFPWSDASNFYTDALGILHGYLFGTFSGFRPLFSSLLAVLLALTGENLRLVLFLLVLLNAFSAFALALELGKTFGALVGTLSLLFLQIYYRQFAGSTMSEQIGLALGGLALAVLLSAFREKDFKYYCAGLLLACFAMFVRPGAFFILPAVCLLWLLTQSRPSHRLVRDALLSALILLAVWQLNARISAITAGTNSMPLGIFSYTLYGQARGGAGWQQFFADFPNLTSATGVDLPRAAYAAAFAEIQRHPAGLLQGILKSYADFFSPGMFSTFGFVQFGIYALDLGLQIGLLVCLLIGLVKCWLQRANPVCALLLALTVGVLLSIPFVPPTDSSGMRLYAVTIALPCIFAAFGLSLPVRSRVSPPAPSRSPGAAVVGLGVIVLSVCVIFFAAFSKTPEIQALTCPEGLIPLAFYVPGGSSIQVVSSAPGLKTQFPVISDREFSKSLQEFPRVYTPFIKALLRANTPPLVLTSTINYFAPHEIVWLAAPPEVLQSPGLIRGCGQYSDGSQKVIQLVTFQ